MSAASLSKGRTRSVGEAASTMPRIELKAGLATRTAMVLTGSAIDWLPESVISKTRKTSAVRSRDQRKTCNRIDSIRSDPAQGVNHSLALSAVPVKHWKAGSVAKFPLATVCAKQRARLSDQAGPGKLGVSSGYFAAL